MLDKLFSAFSDVFYICFSPDLVRAKSSKSKTSFETTPFVAIRQGKVLAIGPEAEKMRSGPDDDTIQIINPFNHPRLLISDFNAAMEVFRFAIRKTAKKKMLIRPQVIVHPLPADRLAGGIADLEIRLLREMGMAVGGREVHIWLGRELTDEEIEYLDFPNRDEVFTSPIAKLPW